MGFEALGIAFALGLRHAADPDHLVAVTSLVAGDRGGASAAARLGAWWGVGHAATLVALGIPLIALKGSVPGGLEAAAEAAVGVVIVLLAARVLWRWLRGSYRSTPHSHSSPAERHRHLHEQAEHGHGSARGPREALAIGVLHGLAGTGAVVVLMLAGAPSQAAAIAELALFAPASVLSMAVCTGAFAWVLTRGRVQPLLRPVVIPTLGVFGLAFGIWYTGLA